MMICARKALIAVMMWSVSTAGLGWSEESASERVAVGSRVIQEQVEQRSLQEKSETLPLSEPSGPRERDTRQMMAYGASHSCDWSVAYHTATAIGLWNDWVELEDGTTFVVPPSERSTVAYWVEGDILHVLPNHGWIGGVIQFHEFCLYNQMTGQTISVDLTGGRGPIVGHPYSQWISAIDDYRGVVYLQDGTVLAVHPSDRYLLAYWEIGDYIVAGCNDGWGEGSYPNILINVATVDYVRVVLW